MTDIRAFARYFCAMALGSEPDADLKRGLPRPARAEGGCGLSRSCWSCITTTPASALSRGRLRCSGAAGRGVRVPPRHLRHPHQLDEQDLCHLHARRSRRTATSRASRRTSCTLPSYRRFPADDEFQRDLQTARPLQLPQPQLLAAPVGEPRPQGARAGGRIHHRAHPAAEREPLRRRGSRRSGRSGSASSRRGCTRSATSRSPATTPSTATGPSPRSAT